MMDHQPQYYNLGQLFAGRLFEIPQYQRAYRWEKKHRDALFSDIERSYEDDQTHFMATVVALHSQKKKVNIFGQEHEYFEIVDGQQRITTLILILKAIAKALDREDPDAKNYGEAIDKELVKPDKASLLLLQTNHDNSRHFENYIKTGNYIKPNDANILADRRLLLSMKDCEDFVENWQSKNCLLEDLVTHVRNRLTFLFHQIGDEALVYRVFEVLNSRGIEVSWFDRLKTMLMAIVFQSGGNRNQLINNIHGGWAEIYRTIGLNNSVDSEVLRFTATLRNTEERSRVFGEEGAVELLRSQAENNEDPGYAASTAISITNELKDVAEAVVKLNENQRLRAVTGIAHARLVATAVYLRSDLSESERASVLRCWENVTFRIFGLYGKDARTGVGDYVRLAWQITQKELPTEKIKSSLVKIGENYTADKAIEEIRQRDCYAEWKTELRYFFHRYEEHLAKEAGQNFDNEHWNHIWSESAAKSIEHILPQSSGEEHIHWLGNLTMLPPDLNSKLQDKSPTEKASSYTQTGILVTQDAAKRINAAGKWSEEEIIARESELLKWAAQEWSD